MAAHRVPRPNVLVVIADDLGVHQLGSYGSRFHETPSIDAFGSSGTRFEHAYTSSPVCSPARAGLYTGRHPARLHVTNYIPGTEPSNARLLTPEWQRGLPVEEVTLGDAFKRAGYETAHFGKWHLAPDYNYMPGRPMDPESQGFDEVLVTLKPRPRADAEKDSHHVEELTDRSIEFLRRKRDRPFLCVLAHNAVHRPEMAPSGLVGRFAAKPGGDCGCHRPVLAAMIAQLDAAFGRLVAALEAAGQAANTIVAFTSDHGAFGRSAELKPDRGAKADLYEGGIRVPLIVRVPGGPRAGAGAGVAEPVSTLDLFPTLLDLAGIPPPAAPLDGLSLAPALRGVGAVSPRGAFHWHYPHYHHLGPGPCGAIRRGRFKLIEWFEESIAKGRGAAGCELFDLETDSGESRDLAAEHPELRDALAAELASWRRSVGAQEMVVNPAFDPKMEGTAAPPPPGDAINPYAE